MTIRQLDQKNGRYRKIHGLRKAYGLQWTITRSVTKLSLILLIFSQISCMQEKADSQQHESVVPGITHDFCNLLKQVEHCSASSFAQIKNKIICKIWQASGNNTMANIECNIKAVLTIHTWIVCNSIKLLECISIKIGPEMSCFPSRHHFVFF